MSRVILNIKNTQGPAKVDRIIDVYLKGLSGGRVALVVDDQSLTCGSAQVVHLIPYDDGTLGIAPVRGVPGSYPFRHQTLNGTVVLEDEVICG